MNKVAWAVCAFYIFCICGLVGFLIDLDHIWDVFGLQAPINFSGWNSRPFHTTLVFVMVGLIASGIITALTYGSKLGHCLELLDERIERRVSPAKCLLGDEFDWNISNNAMVVIETVGIPDQGMSYLSLQDCVDYTGFLKGTFRIYRQTTLEGFGIDE
jgi:hypothetical protein